MSDLLKKTVLAGIGAVSLTKDKAKELADELVERGEMDESDEAEFIKELMDKSEKKKEELEGTIEEKVNETFEKMDIASKSDVEELKDKVQQLLDQQ
jgi:poly(hydroxyalkanoate) granule-associated protein